MIIKNDQNFLEIKVIDRINKNTIDYWDANWLIAEIRIKVKGFNGLYKTNLRIEDFIIFAKKLYDLINLKSKLETFSTIENGIFFELHIATTGLLKCIGEACNEQNVLKFVIESDFNLLDSLLRDVEMVIQKFPLLK